MLIFSTSGSETSGEFHQWESPDGRASTTISASTVKNLTREVLDGSRALPKGGIEVGGILVGRVDIGSTSASIHIDGFEPVPCEHKMGPAYTLSETDRARLSEILKQTSENAKIVGLYRSCRAGRELTPDDIDAALLRDYFPGDNCVFLALKPVSMTHCVAEFTFQQGAREAFPSNPVRPLAPVEAPALTGEQSPVAAPAIAEPVANVIPESPRPAVEQRLHPIPAIRPPRFLMPATEQSPSANRGPMWLSIALCFAIGWGGAATYQWWRLSHEPRPVNLGLEVEPVQGILEVKWNGSLPGVRGASAGELSITDGSSEKIISLNREALVRGRYSYSPSSSNLSFRLTMHNPGGTATESMKVLTDSRPLIAASNPKMESATEPVLQKASEPAVQKASEPPQAPAADPPPPSPPVPGRVTASPRVVSEVQPTIPEGIRSRIRSTIVVPVTLHINASGRVVNAVPQGGGDGLYRYLAGRAVTAAKSWRFTPARASDGQPVPAQHTVYFTFRG